MVIEWLMFQVVPETRKKFIEQDEAIWTAALSAYPGFLGKEIWLEPQRSDRITIVIRWQTREQWKSVPPDVLAATEIKFAKAMGKTYKMIDTAEYQIRKFP
jgi:uncharacterized protein (TIGR03792 family)